MVIYIDCFGAGASDCNCSAILGHGSCCGKIIRESSVINRCVIHRRFCGVGESGVYEPGFL